MDMMERLQQRDAENAEKAAPKVSFRKRRWMAAQRNKEAIPGLVRVAEDRDLAFVLSARGLDEESAEGYLDPSIERFLPQPGDILDIEPAVERIAEAVALDQKIAIWGDYDVDGATSTAIMVRTLRAAGNQPTIRIPDRLTEGYGPNTPGLLQLREEGHDLVIIVDSGIVAHQQLAAAKEAGLDCVVIDHHAAEDLLPPAIAIVNPNRKDNKPGFGHMCAAGLAWIVSRELVQPLGLEPGFADTLIDIAALGTVCDVVPLVGINRAIVRRGLPMMEFPSKAGIRALKAYSSKNGKIDEVDLGYKLGPRINAGGRIGDSMSGAILLSSDDDQECMRLAEYLTGLNTERQQIQKEILEEAEAMARLQEDEPCIVIIGEDWHEGVIGIVAGRLKEEHNKPTMVFALTHNQDGTPTGFAKGSGRSMVGFNLGAAIIDGRQKGIIAGGGGHSMAAGATIDASRLEEFKAHLCAAVRASEFAKTGPVTEIDAAMSPGNANLPFATALARMAPFGQGNPCPRFLIRSVILEEPHAGMAVKGHFKSLVKKQGARLETILFYAKGTEFGDQLFASAGVPMDLIVELAVNEWNDRRSVQAKILDARLAA